MNGTETENIITRSGVKLLVEGREQDQFLDRSLRSEGPPGCLLHWGLRRRQGGDWQLPPPALWPQGTTAAGPSAAQTAFSKENGESRILLRLSAKEYLALEFALFFPDHARWDNNGGKNYQIGLATAKRTDAPVASTLRKWGGSEEVFFEKTIDLNN